MTFPCPHSQDLLATPAFPLKHEHPKGGHINSRDAFLPTWRRINFAFIKLMFPPVTSFTWKAFKNKHAPYLP